MADPHARLSVLVDPPLAAPPPVAELQRRAKALRRRAVAGRGGLAAAVAAVVIGTGIALVPGDTPQTLQTAAPPSSTGPVAAATAEPGPATVAIKTFEVDGQEWKMLATRTAEPAICFTLQPAAGDEVKPGCLTPDGRALQAGAADMKSVSFVYGIVAPDVTVVTVIADGNAGTLDMLGAGSGFPVRFVGTVVAPSVKAVELTASRNGLEERVPVPLPDHLRVSSVHGRDAPPTPPSTTATTPRPPASPTTLAPDTPVSTVVPRAPSTTLAPGGGQPKRVQPVAGATDLRKQQFESAVPAGAQALAVRYWSGVEPCYVLGRVDVAEAAGKVTITLWTGSAPGTAGMACIQMAGYYEVIVQLQAPLGGRTVVDGAA
jgi:hypothetical protein